MERYSTYPINTERVNTLSITFLKKHNYLNPNTSKYGKIYWRSENSESSINVSVEMQTYTGTIELRYSYNDVKIKYKVNFISIDSNIGNGLIWYFVCPHTQLRCRQLYENGSHFLHRKAFENMFYSRQIERKSFKYIDKILDAEKCFEKLQSKHFKTHYNNKPTKRYIYLINKLKTLNNYRDENLPNFMKQFQYF